MRVTVEIDREKLDQVLLVTGVRKKSPAIARALDEYLAMKRRQEFANAIREKAIPYDTTNEEIEAAEARRASGLEQGGP